MLLSAAFPAEMKRLVPSVRTIQRILVAEKDKPASFAGSSEWVGTCEALVVLGHYGIPAALLRAEGQDVEIQIIPQLARYFRGGASSPVMFGDTGGHGGAFVVAAVVVGEQPCSSSVLIVDPHFSRSPGARARTLSSRARGRARTRTCTRSRVIAHMRWSSTFGIGRYGKARWLQLPRSTAATHGRIRRSSSVRACCTVSCCRLHTRVLPPARSR